MTIQYYEGAVREALLRRIPNWEDLYEKGYRWLEYQRNRCDLAQTLAVAQLLWPPLIEVEGCVLLNAGAGLQQSLQSLRKLYGSDLQVERHFNMKRLAELVVTNTDEQAALIYDDELITAFGETLATLWSLRLHNAFPDRTFRVELGEDIGEEGLAITFSQMPAADVSAP